MAKPPIQQVLPLAPCERIELSASPGFFGTSQLLKMVQDVRLSPENAEKAKLRVLLDFSFVDMWDVSALLWMVIGLHHYRQRYGFEFALRLPEGHPSMDSKRRKKLDRSADFLRRWRFDSALANLALDPTNLLVHDQRDYFSRGVSNRFYPAGPDLEDETGLLGPLISQRLVEIRNLSEQEFGDETSKNSISGRRISMCIAHFQAARLGDILNVQCGINKRTADLFSDHLLTEALLNMREHPNATVGMMAVAVLGGSRELVLTVADNGDSIQKTIYQRYLRERPEFSGGYPGREASADLRHDLIHFATEPGITSKEDGNLELAGMGLTYIKDDTTGVFGGRLRVTADGVRVTFLPDSFENEEWPHSWPGNLIRIAIPIPSASS